MGISLSRRSADSSLLLSSLEKDTHFQNQFLTSGVFNLGALQSAVDYIVASYSCSETAAEEAINHLLRGRQLQRSAFLSNRNGQQESAITIPATSTHAPRTVPIAKSSNPAPGTKPLTIDANPAESPQAKSEDLTKPVVDTAESRQQKLLNSIKALKVAIGEVAKDMYSTEMLETNIDKVVSKCIEQISAAQSDQTADTVKEMASPLIGVQ